MASECELSPLVVRVVTGSLSLLRQYLPCVTRRCQLSSRYCTHSSLRAIEVRAVVSAGRLEQSARARTGEFVVIASDTAKSHGHHQKVCPRALLVAQRSVSTVVWI